MGINAASTASRTAGKDASHTDAPCDKRSSTLSRPFSRKFDSNIDIPRLVADNALPNNIPAMGMIVSALNIVILLVVENGGCSTHVNKWTNVIPTPPIIATKQSIICPLYIYFDRDTASLLANAATNVNQAAIFHGELDTNLNSGVRMKIPITTSWVVIRAADESIRFD